MFTAPNQIAGSRVARPRHGFVSGTVVLATILLLAVIGLALELGLLYHVELQLQNACDSAALAGAPALLDEDVLRTSTAIDQADNVLAAQQAALDFGTSNVAAGMPMTFNVSDDNDPQSDIVVGWVEDPNDRRSPFIPWTGTEPYNTLQVRGVRSRARSNAVPLWLGSLFGIASADVRAEARATLDQRVYGFRPIGNTSTPVVPLAVLHQGTAEAWIEQATAAAAGTNDNFAVDSLTRAIQAASDGIPEIELRMALAGAGDDDDTTGNVVGLLLGSDHFKSGLFERQLNVGLQAGDLQAWGGQLALDDSGSLLVPGVDRLPQSVIALMQSIAGQNRVWPLFGSMSEIGGEPHYALTGFAAGRLVEARVEDAEIVLVVQPSVLVTSTALVRPLGPGQMLNPWIAKVQLTR